MSMGRLMVYSESLFSRLESLVQFMNTLWLWYETAKPLLFLVSVFGHSHSITEKFEAKKSLNGGKCYRIHRELNVLVVLSASYRIDSTQYIVFWVTSIDDLKFPSRWLFDILLRGSFIENMLLDNYLVQIELRIQNTYLQQVFLRLFTFDLLIQMLLESEFL